MQCTEEINTTPLYGAFVIYTYHPVLSGDSNGLDMGLRFGQQEMYRKLEAVALVQERLWYQ
jgi:hypothetical protein